MGGRGRVVDDLLFIQMGNNNIQLVLEYGFDIEGNQVEKGEGRATVMFLWILWIEFKTYSQLIPYIIDI